MDCVLCGQTTPAKDRFRLREKRGTPTHLGSLIVSLLEADLWENTDCSVCRTCRRALLRLEKLKADYDALKGDLKAKVRRGSRQVRLHSRSPTGTTPAAKRAAAARCRSVQTAAKELFPTGQSISLQHPDTEGETPLPALVLQLAQRHISHLGINDRKL